MVCPRCRLELLASEEMRGETYACPDCDADIAIPPALHLPHATPTPAPTFRSPLMKDRPVDLGSPPRWRAWLRPLAWTAATVIGLATLFCMIDLGRADTTRAWERAAVTLDRLEKQPDDDGALRNLLATIQALGATGVPDPELDGLLTVAGLGHLLAGDTPTGKATLDRLRQAAPASAYVELLTARAPSVPCSTCQGSGRVPCPRCQNTGVCSFCKGKGVAPGLQGPRPAGSVSRASGTSTRQTTRASPPPRKPLKCTACGGTGACRLCAATPKQGVACPRCQGTGRVAASGQLDEKFAAALTMARRDTTSHLRHADSLTTLRELQGVLKGIAHPSRKTPTAPADEPGH